MLRPIILFLFLACLAPQRLHAEPKIEIDISKEHIFGNQIIQFMIIAEWPKDEGAYSFALPDLKLQNLTLVRQGQSQENFTRGDTHWTRKVFTLELQAAEKQAEGIIEAFSLPYMDPETQKGGVFEAPERRVRIHYAKSPRLLWTLLGIALASLLGSGGWLLLRANKRKKEQSQAILYDSAELLKVRALIEGRANRPAKDLLLELDATLRQFITSYYQLGLEKGAGERAIINSLKEKQLPSEEFAPAEKLLNAIAQAKFAGADISESELRDFQREIINYMETKKVIGTVSSAYANTSRSL